MVTRRQFIGGAASLLGSAGLMAAAAGQGGAASPARLAPGAKVLALGHSMIRRGHARQTAPEFSSYARGALTWARGLDPRFRYESWADPNDPWKRGFVGANQGIDGDHIVQEFQVPGVVERLPYAIERRPDILFLDIGTNDINSRVPAQQVVDRFELLLKLAVGKAPWVVLSTIYPRQTTGPWAWPAGDARWRVLAEVNAWIRGQRSREGLVIFDPFSALIDRAEPDDGLVGNPGLFAPDGVHINARGALVAGAQLASQFKRLIKEGSWFDPDPRRDNLIPDAHFEGGSGGLRGRVEGTAASGWTLTAAGSTKISASIEPGPDGVAHQTVTFENAAISFTRATGYASLSTADILLKDAHLEPGDWIQPLFFLSASQWEGFKSISSNLTIRSGRTVLWKAAQSKFTADDTWPDMPWTGWIVGDPIQIPLTGAPDRIGLSSGFVTIAWDTSAQGAGVVRLSRPILRKVEDPRPRWQL